MSERELATVRAIDAIEAIEGADAIEVAVVGGWRVVVKKGEFSVGDLAVYLEIDSWVPTELAAFLSKGQDPREYNGVKGERLRTIKLRGQISQGLLLPLSVLADHAKDYDDDGCPVWHGPDAYFSEGNNVTELLGIQKWEAPVNAQLAGMARGNFPSVVPKTDQERVQNMQKHLRKWHEQDQGLEWEITEKLEGSSMTVYLPVEGDLEVCSRNLSLKKCEDNSFWKLAILLDLEERMREFGYHGLAIQGELIGPGVQNNIYKLSAHEFRVFDVYDVRAGNYLSAHDRDDVVDKLGISHVPVLATQARIEYDMELLISMATGKSVLLASQEREGIVFKCIQKPELSFKSISNRYLIGSKL